jgi:glucan 1,3-beta-glucosidase
MTTPNTEKQLHSTGSNNPVVNVCAYRPLRQAVRPSLPALSKPGNAWIRGNVYSGEAATASPKKSIGERITTFRPLVLVNSTGFYHTVSPPTCAEYGLSQVINVKQVAEYPVQGDGTTDDTASLQAILKAAASKQQLAYFPHGIYLLTDTLHIPPGSRLFGESFTEFSATGNKFKDVKSLRPMIRVGNAGDVGVAQITDFVFTVAEVLPAAVLVEVNMAGDKPGNVGCFN